MPWNGRVPAIIAKATSRICVGFASCSIPWNNITAVFVPSNAAIIVQRLSCEEVLLSTLTEPSLISWTEEGKGLYFVLQQAKN